MRNRKIAWWRVVENVALAIEESYAVHQQQVRIERNAKRLSRSSPGTQRQIDLVVEAIVGARVLRVGVEVKAQRKRLGIDELGELAAKLQDVDLDRMCVVSTSGFTKGARQSAQHHRIELLELSEIPPSAAKPMSVSVVPVWIRYRIKHATFHWNDPAEVIPRDVAASMNLGHVDVVLGTGQRVPLFPMIVHGIPVALAQVQPTPTNAVAFNCRALSWRSFVVGERTYSAPEIMDVYFEWGMEETEVQKRARFSTAVGLDIAAQVWFDGQALIQTSVVERVTETSRTIHVSHQPLVPPPEPA